jgi:hypothetical protein
MSNIQIMCTKNSQQKNNCIKFKQLWHADFHIYQCFKDFFLQLQCNKEMDYIGKQ